MVSGKLQSLEEEGWFDTCVTNFLMLEMVRGVEKDFIFSVEEGMKWQCVGQRCRTRTTVGSLQ